MGKHDKRIDAYIARSAPFARPVLAHLRAAVHAAVPGAEETIKWGFPHFEYHGILCSMAAFKEHCAFGFWKASLMSDPGGILRGRSAEAMGQMGKLRSVRDLPGAPILRAYLREAARLNAEGVKRPARPKVKAKRLQVPAYFRDALRRNPKARDTFAGFTYSARKEYVEWVTEAKTEKTRLQRLASAVAWMAQGKKRNWKYA